MMRKKITIAILGLSSALCVAAATSCTDKNKVAINGFDVEQTIEVDYGAFVELETPFVTDSNGWLLESWTSVTDKDGNYVVVTEGKFRADDTDGYTITYVVRDSADKTYQKTTSVTVNGSAADLTTIDVTYEQFVELNETIEINATCSNANAVLEYSVTKKSNDASVTLTENTFVLTESGTYTVNVKEKDGKAEYTYTLFAQEPLQEGEVESFNASWVEKEDLINSKRKDWKVTTTEESGILDPYGRAGSFATFTTSKEYISLYIDIREDLEYYEKLAQEGYTSVTTWIYIEASKPHISMVWTDPGRGMYRKDGPDLYPGTWVEYTHYLDRETSIAGRDFVRLYQYWHDQSMSFLQVDNTNIYNPWGGGDTITFYITDVYATKPVTITKATDVETAKTVGDTIDVTTMFTADCELDYSVIYRGETLAIDDPTAYKFLGNGTYEIRAYSKTPNYSGSASLLFNVTDGHSVTGTPLIKELTGESVEVSLSELDFAFNETDGVTPVFSGYTVYYNGEAISLTDGKFTATQAGTYTVEGEGTYTVDGTEYVSYHSLSVDVFTQATKYKVIDENNLLGLSVYTAWDPNPSALYGEYTVGGRTGEMIYSTSNAQSLSVYGKPFYSKHYYETLLSENANAQLLLDLYISANGSTMGVRGLFTAYTASTSIPTNGWQRVALDLQTFIDEYDTVADTYANYKQIVAAGGRPRQGSNGTGALFLTTGDQGRRYVYMDIHLGVEASAGTATLNTGAELLLDTDNDLNTLLDIKLDGLQANITAAEVCFNDEWITLDNAIFHPVWAGDYAAKLSVETPDGLLYKTIETTLAVGDGAEFTPTVDETVHALIGDTDFNVAELIGGNYEYEVEVWHNGGVTLLAEGVEFDGEKIKGDTLAVGSYLVNVYAVRGDNQFAKALYYTFYLNRFANSADELVWTRELTSENYKTLASSYMYTSNQNLQGVSVTNEIPEDGAAGNYLKYKQSGVKEDIQLAVAPIYAKSYYEALLSTGMAYVVKFDVYVENQNADCARTEVKTKLWNTKSDGTHSFATYGTLTLGEWHTIEVDLQYYVDNWGNYRLFGINLMSPSTYEKERVNVWLGNIRLEEGEMMWIDSFTADNYAPMMKVFYDWDYSSAAGESAFSITNTIPEGGTAGTYLYFQQNAAKQDVRLQFTPQYNQAYYQALLNSGKKYAVTFDVYMENQDSTSARTEITPRMWRLNSENVIAFGNATSKVKIGTWYTISYDLQTLVDNWSSWIWLFGTSLSKTDYLNFYLGNVQLVEGEASATPIEKA